MSLFVTVFFSIFIDSSEFVSHNGIQIYEKHVKSILKVTKVMSSTVFSTVAFRAFDARGTFHPLTSAL